MCLDDKRQRWRKQNSILYVPASLLKIQKARVFWAGTYFTYFHPTRAVHVQANAESHLNDLNPAKDGVIRKMSCRDVVATVCLSQQRCSTFVLISGQCQESAPFISFLRGMSLSLLPDEDESSVHATWKIFYFFTSDIWHNKINPLFMLFC